MTDLLDTDTCIHGGLLRANFNDFPDPAKAFRVTGQNQNLQLARGPGCLLRSVRSLAATETRVHLSSSAVEILCASASPAFT